jgi:hypothetical protein
MLSFLVKQKLQVKTTVKQPVKNPPVTTKYCDFPSSEVVRVNLKTK